MADGDKRSPQPMLDANAHEALSALVRLLARQAAADWVKAQGASL